MPLKLEKLHPYGALKVLPIQLLNRTLYLKYVEELVNIIQRLKALIYKDLMSRLYISLPVKTGSSSNELARLYPPFKKRWLYTPLP